MQVGIIGLPNAGKSTIFNALTRANAGVANFPFSTIEPNTGLISVPDENLGSLAKIFNSSKITYSAIKVLDVAGLVKGASRGEGLGNKFLSHIREVDVLAHVVRCFYDENVTHVSGGPDPLNDIETISTELLLADLETLERREEKYLSLAKSGDQLSRHNLELIKSLIIELDTGRTSEAVGMLSGNAELASDLNLLSAKPLLFVANLNDDSKSMEIFEKLSRKTGEYEIVKIYGRIENELSDFTVDESNEYRKELGIDENGLEVFIRKCYRMLDLITFYTINENETRAWPLKSGSKVLDAAGKVHSDMQRGFIKADIINCRDLLKAGSFHHAREEGKVKIEGREYTVTDGDVIQIKFSV